MRYRTYERNEDNLPGKASIIRTGPVSSIWFGAQGFCLTVLILFWPLLIGAYYDPYYQHYWWIWFIVVPGQIIWTKAIYGSIKRARSGSKT